MTLEDIEAARQLQRKVNRLNREIRELRSNPLPSKVRSLQVNGKTIYTTGGHSSLPSSPVEKQVAEILQKEEELQHTEASLEEFRAWLQSVPDPEIRSIIHWRVFQLRTWEQVSRITMGSSSKSSSIMRLSRYLEK